ncbi:MAG: aspartate kinase [Bdellovibrionales bacterium]|nr:aspartate kinase [Bdellovibrionales bacterium]
MGSVERIENVAERVMADQKLGQMPLIVASAMSGETNRLVKMANELDPYYRGPAYDMLLASGEQVSISLLAMALEKRGVKAVPLLAHQVGIQTDTIFSKARIVSIDNKKLLSYCSSGVIPIVAGFQGVTNGNQITTLGRGGSDTTAVAVAAALGAEQCEIYTDVPAVFSADPRLVPKARELKSISFEEMMEMASLGSKVLHFRSVEIAAKYNIKIHLRSSFEKREGTWILPEVQMLENPVVSSVTHDASTVVMKLYPVPEGVGFLSDLFTELAEKNIVVDIITQSLGDRGQRLNFSIHEEDLPQTEIIVKKHVKDASQLEIMRDMSKISVIGVGMKNHPGVAARFFQIFKAQDAKVHLVTTSDIKISAVIDKDNLKRLAEALHKEFDLDA